MANCPKCGLAINDGMKFCGACGSPIPLELPDATIPGMDLKKDVSGVDRSTSHYNIHQTVYHGTPGDGHGAVPPGVSPTSGFVECDSCGCMVDVSKTFRCRECGRKPLCREYCWDAQRRMCKECAEEQAKAKPPVSALTQVRTQAPNPISDRSVTETPLIFEKGHDPQIQDELIQLREEIETRDGKGRQIKERLKDILSRINDIEGNLEDSKIVEKKHENYVETAFGMTLEMVWIEGGSFMMGSPETEEGRDDDEGPVHEVELDGFWMGKYEVTQGQYEVVMGSNPSKFKGPNNPVEQVSWNDAVEFCHKLSQKAGGQYALPSEAQWEYGCRAGGRGRFCFGDSDSGLGDYAWYGRNSDDETHAVGSKRVNGWGLYDMHGNVYEWCGDWYGEYASGRQKNPTGPSSGKTRVLRGGSWINDPGRSCRSAYRFGCFIPADASCNLGFRVVCVARSQ